MQTVTDLGPRLGIAPTCAALEVARASYYRGLKLLGPTKWTYYYLYVLLDVFSRYVVGWMLAHRELARLAEQLIAESCERQGIAPGQLTVHRPRGGDDLEAGRAVARRSRRHQVPLAPACLERQPVLRVAVQDHEVPARLSGPLRLDRARAQLLRRLLPL